MAQQNIDFGSFPNDPAADPIRAAFQKVQNNFTELYSTVLSTGVTSIDVGSGLELVNNRKTGNVVINNKISQVRIQTGNSLLVGVTTATGNSATITTGVTPFVITLAPNISTVNATFTGSTTTSNLHVSSYITSNLIPKNDLAQDLGSPTHRWKDLYLSGNTFYFGDAVIEQDASGAIVMPSVQVTGTIDAGAITASYVTGQLTSGAQPGITSVGILDGLSVTGNIASGNLSLTGSLTTQTMLVNGYFQAQTIVGNIVLPPGAQIQSPGSDTQLLFNSGGNVSAIAGMTFNKTSNALSVTGSVTAANITTTGISATTLTTSGNITSSSIAANGSIAASGNLTAANISTSGTVTAANLSGTNLSATTITTSGSLSSPTITSTNVSATGTVTASTFTGTNVSATGTMTASTFTGTNVSATGTMTASTFTGTNVSASGTIAASAITGANISASGLISAGSLSVASSVSTPTVTSTNVSATGTITATNLTGTNITTSGLIANTASINGVVTIQGNVVGANFNTTGLVSAQVGNISNLIAGNLSTDGRIRVAVVSSNVEGGTVEVVGNANIGNITLVNSITGNVISVTGNVDSGNLITLGILSVKGTANVGALNANGAFFANGNGSFTGSGSFDGTLFSKGLVTANVGALVRTSLFTDGTLDVTGVSNVRDLYANGSFNSTGPLTTDGLLTANSGAIIRGNLNLTGNAIYTGNITSSSLVVNSLMRSNTFSTTNDANVGSFLVVGSYANIKGNLISNLFETLNSANVGTWLRVNEFLTVNSNITSNGNLVTNNGMFIGSNVFANTSSLNLGSGNAVIRTDGTGVFLNSLTAANFNTNGTGFIRTVNSNSVTANFISGGLVTPAQPNITLVGTLSNLTVSASVLASSFTGNGYNLTGIQATNIIGSLNTAQTVTAAAQPNITSLGTLSALSVTSTITSSSTVTGAALVSTGTVTATTSVTTGTAGLYSNGAIGGTLISASQGNITSVGTLSTLNVTGNISTQSYFVGNGYFITSINGQNVIGLRTTDNVQFRSLGVGTGATGTSGEIVATNNITAYYSDDRLKTKLGNIENALDKIDELSGFYYEENDLAVSLGYPRKRQVGLSAQQVQKVLPEVVTGAPVDPEKYLTIWYEKTIPLLVEGIKELRREINDIKKKLGD